MRQCQILLMCFTILVGATSAVAASNIGPSVLVKTARSITQDQDRLPNQRFLGTQEPASDDADERGIGTSLLEKAKTLLRPKASNQNLADMLRNREPVKEVFGRLQLKVTDELIGNPKFVDWVKYVDDLGAQSGKVVSTIPTLTGQVGDEVLFKILDAAMWPSRANTQKLAARIQAELIAHWTAIGKPPTEVFKIAGADKPASGFFTDSLVAELVKYFGDWSTKHTDEAVSMLPSLIGRYDDEVVFKILEAAKKTRSTQRLATKLQADQIQHWSAVGKSPNEVLKIFGADETASGLFMNSHFADLVKYFDNWNTKHTDEVVSLVSKAATQYGDGILFKILQEAKRIRSTKKIATKLQAEQIQRLQSKNEHPKNVFAILGLHEIKADQVLPEVFGSPLVKTWVKYLQKFNTKNPQDETSVYTTMRSYFNVENVVEEAMKIPEMSGMAKWILSEKFRWYLKKEMSPADMFYEAIGRRHITRANPSEWIMNADNFLDDPMFKMWTRYLFDFNKRYPDQKIDMIKSLLVKYTDDTLSQALIAAKNVPSTEKVATDLQLSLLNKWAREKKPAAEVSELLHGNADTLMITYMKKYNWALKNVVDEKIKVLDDLDKKTWLKYVDDLVEKKRDASLTISEATDRYGGKAVAKMIEMSKGSGVPTTKNAARDLQNAQIKGWLDSKLSLDDVFDDVLKLHEEVNMRLDNPLLTKTFRLFLVQFKKKNPPENLRHNTDFIGFLRKQYGDEDLSKILIEGKTHFETKETGRSLQNQLLDKWLGEKRSPKIVYSWLKNPGPGSAEGLVYQKYWMDHKAALNFKG